MDSKSSKVKVADFYAGKSVLITGAAGFLGVVLLEILLRCCPGIETIFILLREKKGVSYEERKKNILQKMIFKQLREESPEVLGKVQPVEGDVSQSDLGLKEEVVDTICEKVSVVFHCAASVNFLKPLRFMIKNNSQGTKNVIEFCRKIKRLDALVFSSTSYSNSNQKDTIKESVYQLPFAAEEFLKGLDSCDDESLSSLINKCKPKWPNHYTFSKCLAENILLEAASDLPLVIVRPSVIVSAWKGSLPSYTEEGSGLITLMLAIGKGFVQTFQGDPDIKVNFVPVDVVANVHVVAAWSIATSSSPSPMVINCTATIEDLQPSLKDICNTFMDLAKQCPLPNSFQNPSSLSIQKNAFFYWLSALYMHYTPAAVIDLFGMLIGREKRLLSLYMFFDTAIGTLTHFLINEWTYETGMIKKLDQELDPSEKEKFYVSLEGCQPQLMVKSLPNATPFFDWQKDEKSINERKKLMKRNFVITTSVKYVVLFLIALMFYYIL